jgi:hypothetical protein
VGAGCPILALILVWAGRLLILGGLGAIYDSAAGTQAGRCRLDAAAMPGTSRDAIQLRGRIPQSAEQAGSSAASQCLWIF